MHIKLVLNTQLHAQSLSERKRLHLFFLFFFWIAASAFAEKRSSIEQYGITWTFDKEYECGQFVTGDWWVVGPVTIVSVTPEQSPGRNGSCVNPMPGRQGYDDRTPYQWNTADRVTYPINLLPNQSLVSSVSKPNDYLDTHQKFGGRGVLDDQAVLTVVASPVTPGTFRPGYSGTYKKYFNISELNMALLPNVPPPASAPEASEVLAYIERPRIDHISSAFINDNCAENNWYNGPGAYTLPCYGRFYSSVISISALYAMLDAPNKSEVVNNLIQLGIDNYSVLKAGGSWIADGGHNSGRKFPIVFAAVLLNDIDMLQIGAEFSQKTGADNHTYYGNNSKALWGKEAPADYFLNNCSGGGAKDSRDPSGLEDGCPDYRLTMTSPQWVGQMLATLMVSGKRTWNHDAYFDYVDRWMTSDPSGGSSQSTFVDEMWSLYRDNLPETGGTSDTSPVANAGPDLTVNANAPFNLDGTSSIDPNGETLLYNWKQISGPSITIMEANEPTASAIPSELGTYIFELAVENESGVSAIDQTTVIVNSVIEKRSSIEQYGITWTFDKEYECGQFVTGDWWVVGPVTIVSATPEQSPGRNGSVLNPTPGVYHGYDDRSAGRFYRENLRVDYPLTLSGTNSLVSTASVTKAKDCVAGNGFDGYVSRLGHCDNRSSIQTMAVLTIVDNPILLGTFRPSFVGADHKEFNTISQVDYNVLPRLPQPPMTPSMENLIPNMDRPLMDHFNSWTTQLCYAFDNGSGYGTSITRDMTDVAVTMMLDIPESDLQLLSNYMIQRGIDTYGAVRNGAKWPADGGHASGRKLPVLISGKLLNHSGMLNIGRDYGDGTFGEDCQTYFDASNTPRWGIRHCQDPSSANFNDETNNYRFCCTSSVWGGQSVVARILHLDDEWNHPAFFAYTQRWVDEGGSVESRTSNYAAYLWNTYNESIPAEISHNLDDPD
ncbi:MAG: PKD domain-containing protein, partial [Bacteroidota bacterium]